jgi:hypothetical protein
MWIEFAKSKPGDQWPTVVNMIRNVPIPKRGGEFLDQLSNLPRRTN